MNRPPSPESVKAAIGHALPTPSIVSIQILPSSRLQRDLSVVLSDGRRLVLTLPPPPTLRLLRSEQWLVLSEALIIPWIGKTVLGQVPRDARISISYLIGAESPGASPSRPKNVQQEPSPHPIPGQALLHQLPALVAHSPFSPELGMAFNLVEPSRGTPISSLSESLAAVERRAVEYQKGQLVRRISSFKSPNAKFGPAVAILGSSLPPAGPGGTVTPLGPGGVESWATAFFAMVEGVLRDAEDLAVTISYSLIRHHMQRLGHFLDAVTQSRLVVFDAGSDANVLVSRHTKPNYDEDGSVDASLARGVAVSPGKAGEAISVTGLHDWSSCIFGDPLMASIFYEDDNAEFLDGFRTPLSSAPSPTMSAMQITRIVTPPPDALGESLIEDREHAHVRLLLYECYHAIVCIVKHFYRPTGPDSTRREMEARRHLVTVLNKLAGVDESAGKRPRTASVDVWPVKKPRSYGEA
jgi:hypothetical protein